MRPGFDGPTVAGKQTEFHALIESIARSIFTLGMYDFRPNPPPYTEERLRI